MFYSSSFISFIFISYHFLIPISKEISSVDHKMDDKMLIAFMKGHQETQLSEYSVEKYEAHLGIMYYIRKNWKCDKIADEFEEYERTECQKYRKYLDILYEYLYREYAEIQTVKPKFVFKKQIEIEGPIINAVNCLVQISQFYFSNLEGQNYEFKLNELFDDYFEPKLLNEIRLNYELKLTINEMILQLTMDTANNYKTNESLDGIILKNCGQKFEENLEEMFKKAEEKTIKYNNSWREINDDKHKIIIHSKFDDKLTWTDDALFSEFVQGFVTTNFEKFFKIAKEYSNYLNRIKEKTNIFGYDDRLMSKFGLCETEKMKKHLKQKYEAHLGVVYLMQKNWHYEQITYKFLEQELIECQKYRKYLHILYEYLFRLYVEGKYTDLAFKLPAVKPIFIESRNNKRNLINFIKTLNKSAKYFCPNNAHTLWKNSDYWTLNDFLEKFLANETEMNYEIKKEANWFSKFKQNILEKINGPKNVGKKGKKILNISNEIEDNLRKEFEQKMEKMYENTKEMAKEEKEKLEKAIENAANTKEKEILEKEYDDKFGTFNSSTFL